MATIQKLSHDVIDMIKAGEIIERPASVVKELFENAVDAGATEILVELIDGGKALIKVQDNGCGIESNQIHLALERHATSKLRTAEDLLGISSFGFRGEALASIAGVSKVTIKTRTANADLGTIACFENGLQTSERQDVMPVGTCLEIRDLFFNIPVRQKFLKSTSTEFAHVQDYLLAMCLAYPSLSLRFIHNGRESFRYPKSTDLKNRFAIMYREIFDEFLQFSYDRNGFAVEGFVSKADAARPNPKLFLTFVNGRLVKDRTLRAGLLQAYSGLIMKGMVPSAVLFVNVPAELLDVNAHPAKTEVRFSDPMLVQDIVTIGVQNAVKESATRAMAGGISTQEPSLGGVQGHARIGNKYFAKENLAEAKILGVNHSQANQQTIAHMVSQPAAQMNSQVSLHTDPQKSLHPRHVLPNAPAPMAKSTLLATPAEPYVAGDSRTLESQPLSTGIFSGASYLGQFANCYLLFQSQEDLLVVDQHAFHERVLFEELVVAAQKDESMPRQQLLSPVLLPVPRAIFSCIEEFFSDLNKLGFELECTKNEYLAVHSCPNLIPVSRVAETMEELLVRILALAELPSNDAHPLLVKSRVVAEEFAAVQPAERNLRCASVYHRVFATVACHSAVRAGDPLNAELVRRLLLRANDVDFFAHCPHGRPVFKRWSKRDVSQWFFRV